MASNPELVGGPFCRIQWQEINLNSSDQIKQYLFQHGWVPTDWNYKKNPLTGRDLYDDNGEKIKSSPKLTEDSFDSVKGDIPRLIARRNILIHRKRMIKNTTRQGEEKGFLNSLRSDGRIGAGAIPNATNTGRMAHRTIVNVPKPKPNIVYGKELRELFIVPEGYVMSGTDAKALEARIQGHYLYPYEGGPELADLLVNGDIHQANADMWGFPENRDRAKSPFYCLVYGGQPAKLAFTMGCSLKEGEDAYNIFWSTYKPLALFKEDLVKVWKDRGGKRGGFLKGLDGRKLFARSEHSLVNLMFQSAGSIVVKTAALFANKEIRRHGLDCHQIIFYHDELEHECLQEQAEQCRIIVQDAFVRSGKFFNLNVPIVGDSKIGESWCDVH